MMLLLLGILDLISGIALFILSFKIFALAWLFAKYLIAKFLIFMNFVSFIDLVSGILMVAAIYGFYPVVTWLAVIWLLQKGLFSVFR